jgi:hypothetical protein
VDGQVKGQTGIKADAKSMTDPYFKMLGDATKNLKLLPGPMELGMDSTYRDVFFKTRRHWWPGRCRRTRW